MTKRIKAGDLQVAQVLHDFIQKQAIPGTGVEQADFWHGFGQIVADLALRNRALLDRRDRLQAQIDEWCRARRGARIPRES